MTEVIGTIEAVAAPRKFGKFTNYGFKVDGQWYSANKPVPPKGSYVIFDATQNGEYWNVTKNTEVELKEAGEPTSTRKAANGARGGAFTKDDYWRNKEARDLANEPKQRAKEATIELQSCRNSAIELVKLMLTPGLEIIPKLPAANKREEFVFQLVQTYTEQFLDANEGLRASHLGEQVDDEQSEENESPGLPTGESDKDWE